MRKYTLAYEDRDVINNPSIYSEMVQKSGQSPSPCVEVNRRMLADVSGDEVEAYVLKAGMVQPTAASADQPRLRRITMSNACQEPEAPARSATIKPTQALCQN